MILNNRNLFQSIPCNIWLQSLCLDAHSTLYSLVLHICQTIVPTLRVRVYIYRRETGCFTAQGSPSIRLVGRVLCAHIIRSSHSWHSFIDYQTMQCVIQQFTMAFQTLYKKVTTSRTVDEWSFFGCASICYFESKPRLSSFLFQQWFQLYWKIKGIISENYLKNWLRII